MTRDRGIKEMVNIGEYSYELNPILSNLNRLNTAQLKELGRHIVNSKNKKSIINTVMEYYKKENLYAQELLLEMIQSNLNLKEIKGEVSYIKESNSDIHDNDGNYITNRDNRELNPITELPTIDVGLPKMPNLPKLD